MNSPHSLEDLKALIANKIQENIHLDYKASPALSKKNLNEIAKDVSAFANSDGGVIIYGVKENGQIPEALDQGVRNTEINREWIENILNSNISPKIPNLKIVQIPKTTDSSYFVLIIPKSYYGPHQAPSKHYFKRYNFSSCPMEHYEIEDLRNRKKIVSSLVVLDMEFGYPGSIMFVITNPGNAPAQNILFEFSEQLTWGTNAGMPSVLCDGMRYLSPGKTLRFFHNLAGVIFKEEYEGPSSFSTTVSYDHPELGARHTETFFFDFNDFRGAVYSRETIQLEQHLARIARAVEKIASKRR